MIKIINVKNQEINAIEERSVNHAIVFRNFTGADNGAAVYLHYKNELNLIIVSDLNDDSLLTLNIETGQGIINGCDFENDAIINNLNLQIVEIDGIKEAYVNFEIDLDLGNSAVSITGFHKKMTGNVNNEIDTQSNAPYARFKFINGEWILYNRNILDPNLMALKMFDWYYYDSPQPILNNSKIIDVK